ncbi:hypothetical protein ACFPIJ_15340 [Dactylosporangium cerinum]|uniref:Dioxygenase n=1 Tax=Dactylosporangium cerinum TaxID=1434730 RepID=A0ABV9VT06_9ACTN
MTVIGHAEGSATHSVTLDGTTYPAEEIAQGAAFEVYATQPGPGFLPNPRPGARWPFRRFVHATEVAAFSGTPDSGSSGLAGFSGYEDEPLLMPVTRALDWTGLHKLTQTPSAAAQLAPIRRTAAIRRGTRMIKFLTGRQLGGHLRGWPISGFCYRAFDVAHLRTPIDLAILSGGIPESDGGVVFAIRWRAVDEWDYEVPLADSYAGLVSMPPHDRLGSPVIGTGFAPSGRHIVPEFVTRDLAELPVPANTSLVAYTGDGTEVTLYTYLPEQRAWSRMHGPQWRHLLPETIAADQEYFPAATPLTRYVGRYRDNVYEAIVDPPGEFRVAAKTRAARYPLDALARRIPSATWRDAPCTVIREEGDWLRLRLSRPDGDAVARLGAHCVERGLYEAWAPGAEVTDARADDHWFDL